MILRVIIRLLGVVLLTVSCQSKQDATSSFSHFPTIDYVSVGKRLPQVQTPYIIDLANHSERLVFVGCNHVRDSTDQQFTTIQRLFAELNPQIGFNEGGQLKEGKHYPGLNKAAFQAGETGVMKYLCDQAGIALVNGDTPDSLEFTLALHYYPKQELYLYYVMERIVIPYLSLGNQQQPFEPYFDEVVRSLVDQGFPLVSSERSLGYFKSLYHQYMHRPFELSLTQEVEKFDYINGGSCHFCEIGRRSKMIRDSILLTKLDGALDRYDRVMVTFGCGHAMAIEPALRAIVNKQRRGLDVNVCGLIQSAPGRRIAKKSP